MFIQSSSQLNNTFKFGAFIAGKYYTIFRKIYMIAMCTNEEGCLIPS